MYREYFKTNPTVRIAVMGTERFDTSRVRIVRVVNATINNISVTISFIGGGNQSIRGTNPDKFYNINCCIKYTPIDKGGNRIHNFRGDWY